MSARCSWRILMINLSVAAAVIARYPCAVTARFPSLIRLYPQPAISQLVQVHTSCRRTAIRGVIDFIINDLFRLDSRKAGIGEQLYTQTRKSRLVPKFSRLARDIEPR